VTGEADEGVDGARCDPDFTPPGSAVDPSRPDVYVLRPEHEAEPVLHRVAARGGTMTEAIAELVVELEAVRATAAHALGISFPKLRAPRGVPDRCVGSRGRP
jgi:hypothetical protein